MKTLADIQDVIAQRKPELEKKFHIRRIGIFGSFARGEATKKSDIDILVEFEPAFTTFDNIADTQHYLEQRLRRKVDLILLQSVRRELQPYILREVVYV